ncbi:MAG TPA: hypothetical protein VFT64_01310 [Rickettsiales bacterium]|nr:hypothetical protein [Rickettsiales bacterium]
MRIKQVLFGILLLVVTGCSSDKPSYVHDSVTDMMHPKPGMARIAVYYPASHFWKDTDVNLSLGARSGCTLKSGTFSLYDVTPGRLPVAASRCDGSAPTQLVLQNVQPDQVYYIQIVPNDSSVLGLFASSGVPSTKNPKEDDYHISAVKPGDKIPEAAPQQLNHAEGPTFVIDLIDEKRALEQLHTLKMVAG